MSLYKNLSTEEKAKVESKLAALHAQTGHPWSYQIHDKQWQTDKTPFLEIAVDGRISRPLPLPETTTSPAEELCRRFDDYAVQHGWKK